MAVYTPYDPTQELDQPLLEDDGGSTGLMDPIAGLSPGTGEDSLPPDPGIDLGEPDPGGGGPAPEPTPPPAPSGDSGGYQMPAWMPEQYGSVLAGWDPAKWADPSHVTPKYVVGRILSNYNLADEAQRNQAIADIQQAYPGVTFDGKDTIMFPGIGPVDIFGGASTGAYRPQWLDLTQEAQSGGTPAPAAQTAPPAAPASVAAPAYDTPTSSTVTTGGTGTSATLPAAGVQGSSDMQNAYREAIMALLGTPQTVDAQELYSSPESAAFRLAAQRAEERQRAQLAEDAGYQGTSNLEGRQRQLGQARGEAEANFIGQLALQRMQDNRDRLFQGLQLAQATGQFDEAQRLARDLAALDAAIRRETLSLQGTIANNQLGYNYASLQAQLNRDATLAAMGA